MPRLARDNKDTFSCMGSETFKNKHRVGILVNKKCRKHINWTDYICERAILRTTTLKRCTNQSRNSRIPKRRTYKLWEVNSMPNWDQGMELNVSVLDRTHTQERRQHDVQKND